MNDVLAQVRPGSDNFRFLDRCADFYQEIASIKSALAENRLAAYLAPNEAQTLSLPSDFAQRVSARLLNILRQQERDFRQHGSPAEVRIHKVSLYLMTALADEIFILELDWLGRDAWLDVLLEQKLFNSSNAGLRFFNMAQQLIKQPRRNRLSMELAAVFLMALELGFKGCYRGRLGQISLLKLRKQLYQIIKYVDPQSRPINPNSDAGQWSAFSQAYQYTLQPGRDERLAPLSPWRNLSLYALASYLMLSISAWFVLMHPFEKYIGS